MVNSFMVIFLLDSESSTTSIVSGFAVLCRRVFVILEDASASFAVRFFTVMLD
jgi:hypothetical protein